MINFSKIPAFKSLILLLFFIFSFKYFLFWANDIVYLLSFLFLLIIIVFSLYKNRQLLTYFSVLAVIGLLVTKDIESIEIRRPNKVIDEIPAVFKGEILKISKRTDKFARCIAVGSLDTKILPMQENTKILLIITSLNDDNKTINVGNKIFANCYVRLPAKKQLPTDFPEDIYYLSQDIQWLVRSKAKDIGFISQSKNLNYFRAIVTEKISSIIYDLYDENIAGIIKAVTIGDKSDLNKDYRTYFSLTGTAHILAVSGLHIGIIAVIIYFLLGFIENRWIKFITFSICILIYVLLTDYQPSATRAAIMAILILYIKNRERDVNLINVVSFVIFLTILVNPKLIYSISFQMSAISVLGISFFYTPIYNKLKGLVRIDNIFIKYLLNGFSLSLSASIAVSPIVAHYFQVYSYFAPLTNLLIIPMISLSYIWSLFSLLTYPLYSKISELFKYSAEFLINTSLHISKFISEFKFTYYTSENAEIIAIALSLSLIYIFFSSNTKSLIFRILISFLICMLVYYQFLIEPKFKNTLIVKDKYTAIIAMNNIKGVNLILADRRPQQYPSKDIAMINYMKQLGCDIKFFYTGEVSRQIAEELRDLPNVSFYPLTIEELNLISNRLGINKLQQIIEYDLRNE